MAAAAAAPAQDAGVSPYRWIILVGLITAAILEVLDTTIVNVALPQMAGNLGATSEEIGWVSTGYILSNVVVLPLTAWLSSRFGRKRYLSYSILLFIAASFMCGTSHSLGSLVFWRIIQGAGGAALLSTAQATLREIFPAKDQGTVQSIYTLGIIAAPTLGPTLGGLITDNYSWNWVFLINLPIGLISFFIVSTFLEDSIYKFKTGSVDWLGIGLLATGLGSLQYVLEEGNSKNWFEDGLIVGLTLLSATTLPLFVWWQLNVRNKGPVVNLRVLKNRDLSTALILFTVLGFGLYGGVFLYPMFAQGVLHNTPTMTGLALLPGGIATGVAAILSGKIANPAKPLIQPRFLIAIGQVLFIISMFMLGTMPSTSSTEDANRMLLLRGFGLGLLFVPINLAAFSSLKGPEIAQGAGLLNLCRQLGGSFGIAVLSSFVTRRTTMSRSGLVEHLYAGSANFTERFNMLQKAFLAKGYVFADARRAAYAVIDQQVQGQAMTIAYNSGFILIGLASLCASPLIFLLRKPKRLTGPPVAVDAH